MNNWGNSLTRFEKFVIAILMVAIAVFILDLSVNAEDYIDVSISESNIESSESSDTEKEEKPEIFDDFENINEKQMIELIDNDEIKYIASSVTDDTEIFYIITKNGKKYSISDISSDMIAYIKMSALEVQKIHVSKEDDNKEDKGGIFSTLTFNGLLFFIFTVIITVFITTYIRKRQENEFNRRIMISSNNSTETENGQNKKIKTEDGLEIPVVRFSDVEGVDELKDDVFRIIDCIKDPEKYKKIGARTPKGIILYGPPGTGKTLLAKAIAGEAGVPFISACASDFVEMYVGVGAKRVRELYKKAKNKAPCIVFIDEIDAVASQRGKDDNSERDQTINALLAELDGFKSTDTVVTICATNRLDMLDSAFTRAGRFDLKLAVGLPDKKSRRKILDVHSKNKTLDETVDLDSLAAKTSGFSGAELEALLNEAAMLAAGHNRPAIIQEDVEDAFFKIVMKGNKKRRDEITETHKLIAWHEAGHTLATKLLTDDEVSSVTIIGSSSGAGGVTFHNPKEEGLHSKEYLENTISIMYAGRAAEEIYLGSSTKITTGASQDIKQATNIIKQYLGLYGMGNLGMIDITQLKPDFGNIVKEATELSKKIYEKTLAILRSNKDVLEKLAEELLEKETLDESDIDRIIKNKKRRA